MKWAGAPSLQLIVASHRPSWSNFCSRAPISFQNFRTQTFPSASTPTPFRRPNRPLRGLALPRSSRKVAVQIEDLHAIVQELGHIDTFGNRIDRALHFVELAISGSLSAPSNRKVRSVANFCMRLFSVSKT